ncbi:MAG: phosphoribosylformylglycinamidine synthase, partial [Bacteroidota bacterium]
MVIYFVLKQITFFAISIQSKPRSKDIEKIIWLLGGAEFLEENSIKGTFVGPRKEMITPWCTNAIEIMSNMGLNGIDRIEMLEKVDVEDAKFDPMLHAIYINPAQDIFDIHRLPEAVVFVEDIAEYNQKEGLALSVDEIEYLDELSKKIKRPLSDSEVFGFSQVNSEHCRHKIFNGTFIIDKTEKESSLFSLIKKTAKEHPNYIVSAYSDNVAFIEGPVAIQFAPKRQDVPDYFQLKKIETVISLKAETHNFPTTVEPFNG